MVNNPLSFLSGFPLQLNSGILFGVFGFFIALFLVISAVLLYHWRTYGMKNTTIAFAETIYFLGSALFLFVALISLARL
ncbi:hypothetical protein EPN83_01830 [Patescibacteria group bacterium]|nr:MAG: hypothetical protein EPN83_01830 [Patescibacteria group bacterium]